jgi:hypothetical protein
MKRTEIVKENVASRVGFSIELNNAEMRGVQFIAQTLEDLIGKRLAQLKEEVKKEGKTPDKRPTVKIDLEDALDINAFIQKIACCHLDKYMFMGDDVWTETFEEIMRSSYPRSIAE